MINTCLLLECFSVWRPLDRTVLPGQELYMRRFFEQNSDDAGFFYRRADDNDAVILSVPFCRLTMPTHLGHNDTRT